MFNSFEDDEPFNSFQLSRNYDQLPCKNVENLHSIRLGAWNQQMTNYANDNSTFKVFPKVLPKQFSAGEKGTITRQQMKQNLRKISLMSQNYGFQLGQDHYMRRKAFKLRNYDSANGQMMSTLTVMNVALDSDPTLQRKTQSVISKERSNKLKTLNNPSLRKNKTSINNPMFNNSKNKKSYSLVQQQYIKDNQNTNIAEMKRQLSQTLSVVRQKSHNQLKQGNYQKNMIQIKRKLQTLSQINYETSNQEKYQCLHISKPAVPMRQLYQKKGQFVKKQNKMRFTQQNSKDRIKQRQTLIRERFKRNQKTQSSYLLQQNQRIQFEQNKINDQQSNSTSKKKNLYIGYRKFFHPSYSSQQQARHTTGSNQRHKKVLSKNLIQLDYFKQMTDGELNRHQRQFQQID